MRVALSFLLLGSACAFMPNPMPAASSTRLFAAVKEAKGQMPVGNGAKVLKHFQTKLKDAGYPAKAADKMFSDYSERELDALFDLSIDEFDKMVEATFNEVGPFKVNSEDIERILDEAAVASEGGEKAQPLGIEADYGGAQDILLMTGLAFERVANKLKLGGAAGADGEKYIFLTAAQLAKFNKDLDNLVADVEKRFNDVSKPIDDKIAHWEEEFKLWESDPIKYTDMLAEIPEGLEGNALVQAFPGYKAFEDKFNDAPIKK